MCELFIGAEKTLWESSTKSLRIEGVVTSIRLENFFWATLEEIGFRDSMTVNQLITKLYFESLDADHDIGNFTSFLRVCCARYHALIAANELTPSLNSEIATVPAKEILSRELKRMNDKAAQLAKPQVNTKATLVN